MPELPEIETTLRGIKPCVLQQKITAVIIKQYRLRFNIPPSLNQELKNQTVLKIIRRGKYLLFSVKTGTLIIHLGMSGRLQICSQEHLFAKHEHVNLLFSNGLALCYIDPRRFGAILWTKNDPLQHSLLKSLGPEPLTKNFSGKYLFEQAKNRKCSVKQFIMNSKTVSGVGNIYANEALFAAGILPYVPVKNISQKRCDILVKKIKGILKKAIANNGTTIRDFATSKGKPGNFQKKLQVYGRANLACKKCKTTLKEMRLGQRSTVFCPNCQA
jgi:formamidopyrimidine-DNA glycosylase